jgi:hypothetical protein
MRSKPALMVEVTVRIDKAVAGRLDDIVRALEASGLTNLDLHKRFLMISGSVAEAEIDALRRIDGVASVREDQTYKPQA